MRFRAGKNVELSFSRSGQAQLPEGLFARRKLLVNLRQLTLPARDFRDVDH